MLLQKSLAFCWQLLGLYRYLAARTLGAGDLLDLSELCDRGLIPTFADPGFFPHAFAPTGLPTAHTLPPHSPVKMRDTGLGCNQGENSRTSARAIKSQAAAFLPMAREDRRGSSPRLLPPRREVDPRRRAALPVERQ